MYNLSIFLELYTQLISSPYSKKLGLYQFYDLENDRIHLGFGIVSDNNNVTFFEICVVNLEEIKLD